MVAGTGDPVWRSESPSSRTAILAALELEARLLRRMLPTQECTVLVSGPGSERAAAAARQAIAAGAGALVAWGLAGGLTADAAPGTVCLPRRLLSEDGAWDADPAWRQRIVDTIGPRFTLLEGTLYSAGQVLITSEAKAALAAATGAAAVDMESAAVARVAVDAGLPFIALRVIADGPADALPAGVEALVTADGRMRLSGLWRMLVSPRALSRLGRLGRRSQCAREVLRQVAASLRDTAR